MSTMTVDEFLVLLKRSTLLEDQVYETALEEIKRDIPSVFDDVTSLAEEYIKRNLLTAWHVRQLMKRKYKGFYLRQYRILGHLGSGGMSSVYLGEHTIMKRLVAIKVLPKRCLNPTYLNRFVREAQAVASLDSPHVVRAYDFDRFEDVHYIVMEFFAGQNLRQLVEKEGPLDYEDAANYIRQAALGLIVAHKSGIVHRDVKPDNIVVNEHGLVKILDLGLALLDEDIFTLKGSIGDEDKILGTADYLAPEQALNSHNVDARADIYSLGATLYFCLVGKPPFPVGTISERLLAHQRKDPVSIFSKRPDAPVDLVEICSNMMAKKIEKRIQSATQVADLMQHWLIQHGFAHAPNFTLTANEGNDEAPDTRSVERFFSHNENATEIEFDRAGSSFRFSNYDFTRLTPMQSNDTINLHEVSLNDTSMSCSSLSPFPSSHDILLSKKTSLEQTLDPIELALSEITDTANLKNSLHVTESSQSNIGNIDSTDNKKNSKISEIKSPSRLNSSTQNNRTESVKLTSSVNRHTQRYQAQHCNPIRKTYIETATPPQSHLSKRLPPKRYNISTQLGDWYKSIPIWFWTLVIGGYTIAFFLAGILFTLLFHSNK